MKRAEQLFTVALVAGLAYYAVIGFAALHMTMPAITEKRECSWEAERGGQLWCMTPIEKQKPLGGRIVEI